MKKSSRLKISRRLNLVFAVLVLIIFLSSVFSLVSFRKIGNHFNTFFHVQYETTKQQMEIRKDVQTINKRMLWAVISNDPAVTAEQKEDSIFSKEQNRISIDSGGRKFPFTAVRYN